MDVVTPKNIGMCPECGAEVRFKKAPYLGQMLSCRRCDARLEVVQRSPVELAWIGEELFDEVEDGRTFSDF